MDEDKLKGIYYFVDKERKDQIFQYLNEVENYPKEKTQLDLTCEQQLAEIWSERSKIFSEYDKVPI